MERQANLWRLGLAANVAQWAGFVVGVAALPAGCPVLAVLAAAFGCYTVSNSYRLAGWAREHRQEFGRWPWR